MCPLLPFEQSTEYSRGITSLKIEHESISLRERVAPLIPLHVPWFYRTDFIDTGIITLESDSIIGTTWVFSINVSLITGTFS
jgi:hypothetical protein